MFTADRSEQRKYLAHAWGKHNSNQTLDPLELQLVKIIEKHPEYQNIINDLDTEYFPAISYTHLTLPTNSLV